VELARPDGDGRHVLPGLRHRVADEVLGAGDDPIAQVAALHPSRERDAHRADQIRVLAVGLGHPAPAGVASDVHDRRKGMEHADRSHLAAHDVRHLLDRAGIPGRGQADRRREGGEARGDHAVERLIMEDRGDLEARLGDQVPLDGVDALCDLVGQLVPQQPDAGDMADAVAQEAVHLAAHRPVRPDDGERDDARQLHRLLLDGHLMQQLVGALHRGGGGVGCDGTHG
jgi:hypothetical protein